MIIRDGKRIASRSQIRIQTRITKRCQQRCAIPLQTGVATRIISATEMPDMIGMVSRWQIRFGRRVGWHMEGRIEDRGGIRIYSRLTMRLTRQIGMRMNSQAVTRIASRAVTPLGNWKGSRVGTPVAMRVWTGEAMRIGEQMGRRIGIRTPTGNHNRVSIRCVSWTAIRMPSYYGRHDSAHRDSARRHAEGRQR